MRSNTGSNRVQHRRLGARTPTHEHAPAGEEAVANGQTPSAQPMPGQRESDVPHRSSIVARPFYCSTRPPLPFSCSTRLHVYDVLTFRLRPLMYAHTFIAIYASVSSPLSRPFVFYRRYTPPFPLRFNFVSGVSRRHCPVRSLKVLLGLLGGECASHSNWQP